MKKIQQQLETLIQKIDDKANDRDSVFDNRSDAWHESDASGFYEDQTEQLRESIENIYIAIGNIESYQNDF